MGRRFEHSTIVFVFGHSSPVPCDRDVLLLGVIRQLLGLGATVKAVCHAGSPMVERIRALGVEVSEYRLDRKNLIRTRSRMRKYLRRYHPPVVHATGLFGIVILGLAARPVDTHVAVSAWCEQTPPGGPIGFVIRKILRHIVTRADLVLAPDERVATQLEDEGVGPGHILIYPSVHDDAELIRRYRELIRR